MPGCVESCQSCDWDNDCVLLKLPRSSAIPDQSQRLQILAKNPQWVIDTPWFFGVTGLYTLWSVTSLITCVISQQSLHGSPLIPMICGPLALVSFYLWYRRGWLAFNDLGKGGTPQTFWWWIRLMILSFFRLGGPLSFGSIFEAPVVPEDLRPTGGYLTSLPERVGPRPSVPGIAPQRQYNQRAPKGTFSTLGHLFEHLAAEHPQLKGKDSYLEGSISALFARVAEEEEKCRDWLVQRHPLQQRHAMFNFEIAHAHSADGSVHLIMHPADIKKVVDQGWGERNPIARSDQWWLFYFLHISTLLFYLCNNKDDKGKERKARPPVPEELVFVYAPRTTYELEAVTRMVKAAASYVTGEVI